MKSYSASIVCWLVLPVSLASSVGEVAATDFRVAVDTRRVVRKVPPGVVGWGAMWKRATLWPTPPNAFPNDAAHQAYIRRLAKANRELIRQADVRHLSWPWGVTFSTFGVNWENSAKPWSQRKVDCVRGSGWCETAIVGVGDLLTLADVWNLEAITVAVPLAVYDGDVARWGPRFFHDDFTPDTIEKISDHAAGLIAFMKRHRAWRKLDRVYLAAGCEWRRYKLQRPSAAAITYAKVVRRIREKIKDDKVWVVASASDGADIPGKEQLQSANWNPVLYEQLHEVRGVVLDLHRYRGMIGAQASANKTMPMTPHNVDLLLRTGVTQRGFLTVSPSQWNATGKAMPTVLLENAIHGVDTNRNNVVADERPWPVVMAHADLLREALSGESRAFLGWTWFPESIPKEWPHGAIRDGKLASHATAQSFLTEYHRGDVLDTGPPQSTPIRAIATRSDHGVCVYGGNFSRSTHRLRLTLKGRRATGSKLELLAESGRKLVPWDGVSPITLPPITLWRVRFDAD